MPALETIKKITEKAIGWGRPAPDELHRLLRARQPRTFRFKDDGIIPNRPRLPHRIARSAKSPDGVIRRARQRRLDSCL
jgi:hypothetical protein